MEGELRCDFKMHGILVGDGTLEVKCDSSLCGHKRGITVLHYFDINTGRLVDTRRYSDPQRLFNGQGAHK